MSRAQSNPSSMYWKKASDGKFDPDTVIGGFDRSVFKKMYLARVKTSSGYVPGFVRDQDKSAFTIVDGKPFKATEYETLVNPDDIFLEWIVPNGDRIPTGAVVADDTNDKKIFIARGKSNGDYVPGVMIPTDAEDHCYILEDEEKVVTLQPGSFEVLCVNTVTPILK